MDTQTIDFSESAAVIVFRLMMCGLVFGALWHYVWFALFSTYRQFESFMDEV